MWRVSTSVVMCPLVVVFSRLTKELLAALQRHYAVLQALALDEDEMPEVKDETAPDEEGMAR